MQRSLIKNVLLVLLCLAWNYPKRFSFDFLLTLLTISSKCYAMLAKTPQYQGYNFIATKQLTTTLFPFSTPLSNLFLLLVGRPTHLIATSHNSNCSVELEAINVSFCCCCNSCLVALNYKISELSTAWLNNRILRILVTSIKIFMALQLNLLSRVLTLHCNYWFSFI